MRKFWPFLTECSARACVFSNANQLFVTKSVSKEMMLFASVFDAFSHEFSNRVFVNCLPVIKKSF